MKKAYRNPQIKVRIIRPAIIAGSPSTLGVSNTRTETQESKQCLNFCGEIWMENNE